jgi:cell division protein FtsX
METIIVKPKNAEQAKEVLEVLKKLKIKTEVYPDRTKEEILNGIEQGAKEAAEYLQGKRKLRSAKEFLNEL